MPKKRNRALNRMLQKVEHLSGDALARIERRIDHINAHRGDALGRIRALLNRAIGQTPEIAKRFLREVVAIDEAGAAPPGWREMVESEYPQFVGPLNWVSRHDVDGKPLTQVPSGHNWALTEEERKLVTDHLPLVRKLAVERASKINNLAGGTTLDHELFAELEDVGLRILEGEIRRWDRTRGGDFWRVRENARRRSDGQLPTARADQDRKLAS